MTLPIATTFRNLLPKTDDMNEILRRSIKGLIIFSAILLLIIYSINGNSIFHGLIFLSVAAAFVLGGAAAGFLFGIPRTEKYRYKPDKDRDNKDYFYSDNTNLEEISDWLTKIIVGLTLVKFNTILKWMYQSAVSMSKTLSNSKITVPEFYCLDVCYSYYVFSYAVMVLYFFAGIAMGYLWTRINFSRILTMNRKDLTKIELSNEEQTAALERLNPLLAEESKNTVASLGVAGNDFKSKAERENKEKQIKDTSDLQKGRWGGKDENNGYKLLADVSKGIGGLWYSVTLKVFAVGEGKTITGPVAFFLHDTFPKQVVIVDPDENGVIKLNITAYEAFTLGAKLFDDTELELDLNNVKGYPEGFYWH